MELNIVKGMRDFLSEDMIKREKVKDTIEKVLRKYGFNPVETPALEYWETLVGKYGEDEKLIYSFEDMGGRRVGLRYDLTVPIVRMFSMNKDIAMPFRPYYISKVWRYDQPGKDRYREFWQADIEIIGCKNVSADAEVIAVIDEVIKSLGIKKYNIRINNRKLFVDVIKSFGIAESKVNDIMRSVDKLDKIEERGVEEELLQKAISKETVKKLFGVLLRGKFEDLKKFGDTEGYKELETLIKYLKKYKVKNYTIDLSLARGLDYYTGVIFEVSAGDSDKSVAGGGRYDKMIGKYTGTDVPATGVGLGFDRLCNLIPNEKKTYSDIFIAPVSESVFDKGLEICQSLREAGFSTEIDLMNRSLRKNIEYASKSGIPEVVIVGEKDLKLGKVTIRDLNTGEEEKVSLEKLKKIKL